MAGLAPVRPGLSQGSRWPQPSPSAGPPPEPFQTPQMQPSVPIPVPSTQPAEENFGLVEGGGIEEEPLTERFGFSGRRSTPDESKAWISAHTTKEPDRKFSSISYQPEDGHLYPSNEYVNLSPDRSIPSKVQFGADDARRPDQLAQQKYEQEQQTMMNADFLAEQLLAERLQKQEIERGQIERYGSTDPRVKIAADQRAMESEIADKYYRDSSELESARRLELLQARGNVAQMELINRHYRDLRDALLKALGNRLHESSNGYRPADRPDPAAFINGVLGGQQPGS